MSRRVGRRRIVHGVEGDRSVVSGSAYPWSDDATEEAQVSAQSTPDLDATVDADGDVVIPAASVSKVVDVHPGDHLRVRIVGKRHARRNMHGVFAEAPIGLDPEDLEELRSQMWRDFGVDAGA